MIKRALAGLAALSLAASPAVAQSSASALSVTAQATSSVEETDGGGASIVPPILAGAVVVFGILLATETWPFDEDDDEPVSP